jgi:hypothetical protein
MSRDVVGPKNCIIFVIQRSVCYEEKRSNIIISKYFSKCRPMNLGSGKKISNTKHLDPNYFYFL